MTENERLRTENERLRATLSRIKTLLTRDYSPLAEIAREVDAALAHATNRMIDNE
jgi:regulator of replication initiation timing